MFPLFELFMISTKSRITLVLYFVFSGTRRNTVTLSLDMMYPQIIFHCIDHEIMDFGSETPFWSSVCDSVLWILCFDLG